MANFGDFLKGVVDYGSSRIAASNDLRDEEAKARMLARLQREEGRSSRVIQEGTRWFEVTVNGDGQEVSRRELSQSEARERNRTEATADAQLQATLIGSKSAERTLSMADTVYADEQAYKDATLDIARQNARASAASASAQQGLVSQGLRDSAQNYMAGQLERISTAIRAEAGNTEGGNQLTTQYNTLLDTYSNIINRLERGEISPTQARAEFNREYAELNAKLQSSP